MNNLQDNGYELLDSGNGRKLERFGSVVLSRPAAAAVWNPALPDSEWARADALFEREDGNTWRFRRPLPDSWTVDVDGLLFKLSVTNFGHLGIFPEQRSAWQWIRRTLHDAGAKADKKLSVLNLFAYSGGATLAAARAGAAVCHLDASKGMVARARENAALNHLEAAPVRWIVEDVEKFLARELRRGTRYDAVILDPPSFGRGKSGEVYKIETDITGTLKHCADLLTPHPLFVLLSCHTPAFTPLVLENLLRQSLGRLKGKVTSGEMLLAGGQNVPPLPSGTFASWSAG